MTPASDNNWPFAKGAEGRLEYAPFGLYGAAFVVPTSERQDKIRRQCNAASGLNVILVLYVLIKAIFGKNRPWSLTLDTIWCVLLFAYFIWQVCVVASQSKGLQAARPRPSLRQMCRICARDVPAWQLWAMQIVAINAASMFIYTHQHPSGNYGFGLHAVLGTLLFATTTVACVCSYILNLKQRTTNGAPAGA